MSFYQEIEVRRELRKAGNIPIAPHVYFPQFMDDSKEMRLPKG